MTIAPLALSAQLAFERNLGKMAAYRTRAREIASALADINGLAITPNPPHTNTFHIFVCGERDQLEARSHAYAKEHGTFVFARLTPTIVPRKNKWEFVVGDATMAVDVADIVATIRDVVTAGEPALR